MFADTILLIRRMGFGPEVKKKNSSVLYAFLQGF
jgi:hypothetical protein